MALIGSLSLNHLVPSAKSSLEGLKDATPVDISRPFADTVKQEAVYHLITLRAVQFAKESLTDQMILDKCLTIASAMLDRGDCSAGTFAKLQNVLPGMIRENKRPVKEEAHCTHQQAMTILDGVLQTRPTGYREDETKLVQEFVVARQSCQEQAQKIVSLAYGHVRMIVPDLLRKYPDLMSESLNRSQGQH
jgi:hypothetical protein